MQEMVIVPGGGGTQGKVQETELANRAGNVRSLFRPIDGSPPGSPVPGILHARTLEWVAISFSNA